MMMMIIVVVSDDDQYFMREPEKQNSITKISHATKMRRFTSSTTVSQVTRRVLNNNTSRCTQTVFVLNNKSLSNNTPLFRQYATEEKVPSELVKQIRSETSAPLGQILKALKATNNNVEEAKKRLRELGMTIAAHKASRTANQGVCGYIQLAQGDYVVFELNCETDFVARGEEFGSLIAKVQEELKKNPDQTNEQLAETLKPDTSALTLKVGENITIPRVERFKGNNVFVYLHNRAGNAPNVAASLALVDLSISDETLGSNIAMHICGMNPLFTDKESVPQSAMEEEKNSLVETFKREEEKLADELKKPQDKVPKILDGRLNKWLKEVCLVDQEYILDSKKTVSQILQSKNATINSWKRVKVGVRD
jgi:elongation factor Ts